MSNIIGRGKVSKNTLHPPKYGNKLFINMPLITFPEKILFFNSPITDDKEFR